MKADPTTLPSESASASLERLFPKDELSIVSSAKSFITTSKPDPFDTTENPGSCLPKVCFTLPDLISISLFISDNSTSPARPRL